MPLLHHEPESAVESLDDLLSIALAMEEEAVRRYRQLAALMDRRGETETADAFRALTTEEEGHIAAVGRWTADLGLARRDARPFVWRLPPDIAASWNDLTDRTRLTPYQALSLAVLNEQRAFAFYSYIAAHSADEAVRRHAESLAKEELGHAALLRRRRRAAFHRQDPAAAKPARADTPADLAALVAVLLPAAARDHAAMARRLERLGDREGAALLADIAAQEAPSFPTPTPTGPPDDPRDSTTIADIRHAAMLVCERLAESFADAAAQATDEAVLLEAQRLQETAVGHLARLAGR